MSKEKIYIAGAISNDPKFKEKFDLAEQILIKKGFAVLNPCKNLGFEYRDYINMGLCELMHCDSIVMLEGWACSEGAKIEHQYAKTVGLNIFTAYMDKERAGLLALDIAKKYVESLDWNLPKYTSDSDYFTYGEYENECFDLGHEKEKEVANHLRNVLQEKKIFLIWKNVNEVDFVWEIAWEAISRYLVENIDSNPKVSEE